MSLRKQLESANTGTVIITTQPRTGVYVAAKRAGVKVSTREVSEGIEVTVGDKVAELPPFESACAAVRQLSVKDRLKLFEGFELCCGMNRGECICVPEVPTQMTRQEKLDNLRAMIANPRPFVQEEPETWQFTKDRPQYEGDRVYRRQFCGKQLRTVRVDEDDHEKILELI